MLSMIGHAVFGLIVGVVAKLLLPGHDPGGLFVTALIGMVGGWLAAGSVARWDGTETVTRPGSSCRSSARWPCCWRSVCCIMGRWRVA